jgi:hypothetical protein
MPLAVSLGEGTQVVDQRLAAAARAFADELPDPLGTQEIG